MKFEFTHYFLQKNIVEKLSNLKILSWLNWKKWVNAMKEINLIIRNSK